MTKEFVKLNKINSTIKAELRYATTHNFLNQKVDGYKSKNIILISRPAAEAFIKVQNDLERDGYSLVFYDAYRPKKACDHFYRWMQTEDISRKNIFYPSLTKAEIFKQGFVAQRSTHSRGSTADITIINKNSHLTEPTLEHRTLANGRKIPFYNDNTVDMGSSFDLFDKVSFPGNKEISKEQFEARMYLRNKMLKHGFLPFEKEWWHFTLKDEPYPDTHFDFDVQ